jgi:23S rRNA pseudouridine1911/1915/1917 synthase
MPESPEIFIKHRFTADRGQEPFRIDRFLTDRVENVTRNKVQQAIEEGKVRVNGVAVKSNYKVKPGDEIEVVSFEEPRSLEVLPEDIPLDIVYEDEDLILLNKQSGFVVHPGHGNYTGTLVNALAHHMGATPKSGNIRPWLVHRIDKDTTGLMVVAKNEQAMNKLAAQFKDHSIERTYKALVWGNFEESKGTVTGHIGRSSRDRKIFMVYPEGDHGKHAVTHYEVLENFNYVSLVACKLETGRTHQIRVHMKHIGHTLFNDAFYGGDKILKGVVFSKYKQFIENCFELLPRQALHAVSLGFIHPSTGEWIQFESELPPDFSAVLERWRSVSRAYDFRD